MCVCARSLHTYDNDPFPCVWQLDFLNRQLAAKDQEVQRLRAEEAAGGRDAARELQVK